MHPLDFYLRCIKIERYRRGNFMKKTLEAFFDDLQIIHAEIDLHYYNGFSKHFKVIDEDQIYYDVTIKGEKKTDTKRIYDLYVEGFIIGAPIVGKVSDMLGGEIKKILVMASSGYVLLWAYVLIIFKGKPPIGQWPVMYFIMGLLIICHILVFSNVKDVNPLKYTGIAISIVNIGEFVGSGLISLSMGYLIKRLEMTNMATESIYTSAMTLVLVSAVLSWIAVMFMHGGKINEAK